MAVQADKHRGGCKLKGKITLENGQEREFVVSDRDVELLEESASYGAQMMGSEGHNAASEIAFGIIPWGIDRIRQQMKGVSRGDLHPELEDEHG